MTQYPSSRYRSYGTWQPKQSKPKRRLGREALILVCIIIGIVGGFWLFSSSDGSLAWLVKKEPPKPEKVRIEGRYLFNGTVVWARYMQDWSKKADGTLNYAYPFSGLHSFDRGKYDAWTADLECASGAQQISPEAAANELVFNCRPEFLPEAAKYFTFFNLANNHSDNLGQDGLEETRTNLIKNGIMPWGDPDPGKTQNYCEIMALPVRVISTQSGRESNQKAELPVAFCAWEYFFRLPKDGEIESMKQYADVMPVFAFIQAGVEYRPKADDYQHYMAHKIADQGPAFVVANSAHWVQDGEVYKGIPILYSTGNFIFDQQTNNEVTRSASLDGTMTIKYTPELQKWLDLAPSCKKYKDDCFEKIKAMHLKKTELSFTYDLVAGDDSNKLSKRAGDAVQQAVEERVGWDAIKAALGQ
jgi:hypothetical protein